MRNDSKMTQSQLAKLIGVHQSMIVRWESGECEPTVSNLFKLSEVFNCSADYLIGKTDI